MIYQPKIIKTLLLSSFVIAIIVTVVTLFIEISQMEDKVITLAKNEVKYFVKSMTNHLEIEDTSFLFIAVMDNNQNVLNTKKVANFKIITQELEQFKHKITTKSTDTEIYALIHNHVENKFYFEFKIALQTEKFTGYVKGLYAISNEEISTIYKTIFYSLAQTILAIFITTLLLYPIIVYLNKEYISQSENLLRANLEIMSVLGGAVAKRDSETNAHNYRVTLYAIKFAENLGLKKEQMRGLIKGAFLHDIGKIGVSDTLLLKPGKLSDEEFEMMKYHVEYGVDIISKSKWLDDAKDVVKYHHERYDAKGYLQGLKGEEIPLNARIFMICDVFDALTSKRPYKEPLSLNTTIKMIKERAGTHFDPDLVAVFCEYIEEYYQKIVMIEDESMLQSMLDKKLHYLKVI